MEVRGRGRIQTLVRVGEMAGRWLRPWDLGWRREARERASGSERCQGVSFNGAEETFGITSTSEAVEESTGGCVEVLDICIDMVKSDEL